MSTVAASPSPLETPSKKVANTLSKMDVNASPSKKDASAKASTVDFHEDAPKIQVPTTHPLDTLQRRFVGDVDLPEDEEPLLIESSRRFVLFPIRFHEVSISAPNSSLQRVIARSPSPSRQTWVKRSIVSPRRVA